MKQNQVRGLTSEQPGMQLHSGPAAPASSLPQPPRSPWLPSFHSWLQTAAWNAQECTIKFEMETLKTEEKKEIHRKIIKSVNLK